MSPEDAAGARKWGHLAQFVPFAGHLAGQTARRVEYSGVAMRLSKAKAE